MLTTTLKNWLNDIRTTKRRRLGSHGNRLAFEQLEERRLLAATISEGPFLEFGLVYEGHTDVYVEFSEELLGAEDENNYELINAGVDGLLDTVDDIPVDLSVYVEQEEDPNIEATLFFPGLDVGHYRLTVRDTITDEAGDALDGDEDGSPGGDWVREFDAIPTGPMGGEFQVNTFTSFGQETSDKSQRSVAMDAAGNFVVTWTGRDPVSTNSAAYGQRFDAAGNALDGEFQITTDAWSGTSSIAMDAAGNFVVTWTSRPDPLAGFVASGQRYDAAGNAQGGEFRITNQNVSNQTSTSVAMDGAGNFVVAVTSTSSDVYGQRYDAAGNALGGEFQIATDVLLGSPSVAVDAAGNFVVTWTSLGGGSDYGVYGQRYNSAGNVLGGEFQVISQAFSLGQQSAAMDAAGNFVVTWTSYDGSGNDIYGQRYDAAGIALGGQFRVNTHVDGNQSQSSIAMDSGGNFVVTWSSVGQDGYTGVHKGVYGQRYDAAGNALGVEFLVNTQVLFNQDRPSVAMLDAEHFVVIWTSQGQDGSQSGVFGQLSNPVVTIPSGSGTINISRVGDDLSITKDGQSVATIALESVLGVTLQGAAESETFTVDIDGLNPDVLPSGITIAAGEGTGDDDTLNLIGSTIVDIYDYTTGGPESGTITLDGFTVNFSEFEPIIDQLNVKNRSFTIGTPGNQTIVLGDDGGVGDGFSIISDGGTGAFESVAFLPPSANLVIDAGDGDDQVIIQQTDSGFDVPVSVAGGEGNDTIDSSQASITLVLDGGAGNDTITGGAGSNVLVGGDGDDTLIDGGGTNTIVAGEGTDDIQEGSGTNTVVTDEGAGNNGPVISTSGSSVLVEEGQTAQKTGTFFDLDESDNVLISADFGAISFQDTGNSGAWTWEYSAAGELPSTTVTVTADDGNGGSNSISFDVTIGAFNTPPTAEGQTVEVTEDGHVSITLVGSDAETSAESLVFTVQTVPTSGSLFTASGDRVIAGATFIGTPTLEYKPGASREGDGSDAFTFTVTDEDVGETFTSDPAVVSVNIVKAVADGDVTIDADGILRIGGTSGNDCILVTRSLFSGQLRTWINGHCVGSSVAASDVSEIHTWGREGNDKITVSGIGVETLIHGGLGNDRLFGDYGSDLIFGGAGNDDLFGGFGDDMLVGGADGDKLFGFFGDDILIGGELSETLTAGELHEALDQWSEEGLISDDLTEGLLDDEAFDWVFGGFGDDWNATS